MSLFKYVHNESDPNESLRRYCPTFMPSMDWESALPFVEMVEQEHIIPAIGSAMYDELITEYAGTMTANNVKLLRVLQRGIAWLTAAEMIQNYMVHISTMGPGETMSQEGTFALPRQWVSKQSYTNAYRAGYKCIESALILLVNYPALYPTWRDDAGHQANNLLLDASHIDKYIRTAHSQIIYNRLRPHIEEAQLRYIQPVVGDALYADLVAKAKNPATAWSNAERDLLDHVRRALCRWAEVCALPALRVVYTENGLAEPGSSSNLADNGQNSLESSARSFWISTQEAAMLFTERLKSYLQMNAALHPLYDADRHTPARPFPRDTDDSSHPVGSLI
jgi:hypothetical protein